MTNKQLADAFAKGATKGKGSNLFIEGDTIYSYGQHFPVATRLPSGFWVTDKKYSQSTSRHVSLVRQAIAKLG
jgi:hypothetical protein